MSNRKWGLNELKNHMQHWQTSSTKVFELHSFDSFPDGKFKAVIRTIPMLGRKGQQVEITEQTNGAMQTFNLVPVDSSEFNAT